MEQTITRDLKRLKLKPRSKEDFQEMAEQLTGKNVNRQDAKAVVREKISDGQVKASNDNIEGLKAQVVREQNGGGIKRSDVNQRFDSAKQNVKGYVFNKTLVG